MTRSSNTDQSHRLNAAFDLLAKGYPLADAAEALTQKYGLSRRQAYRYLQEAQDIDGPVLVVSPSIPITIKMQADIVKRLRSHAQTSGMTIGDIVAQALVSFLDTLHRHGVRPRRSHDIELEYACDRLQATKLEHAFAILVPNRERRIDESTGLKGESHENSRPLHPCFVDSTEEKSIASQTAVLIAFARQENYQVPDEWVFEDEGDSGANLIRPGPPRIRDLAAEGQIQAVLALSPDRLSRKYAYHVLLTEELARHGVEGVFIKAPHSGTPEDQLLIQFQGMIAEYERAQILERSRRGKRHRAKQGEVSVLSGAPYGYRYIRKTDDAAAYYDIIEAEADVVRKIFNGYTVESLSIAEITRQLTALGFPTRKQKPRWERSVIWAILRNPAYQGRACFGKTAVATRQGITRSVRLRGRLPNRNSANHERPRAEWIEILVPALVSEETFALAQEKLIDNNVHALRRTIEPSILQGLGYCRK